jgi:hypothetical protein
MMTMAMADRTVITTGEITNGHRAGMTTKMPNKAGIEIDRATWAPIDRGI